MFGVVSCSSEAAKCKTATSKKKRVKSIVLEQKNCGPRAGQLHFMQEISVQV